MKGGSSGGTLLLGTAPCPWNSWWENHPSQPAPLKQPLLVLQLLSPSPPGGSSAPRGSPAPGGVSVDPPELPQPAQPCPVTPLGSAQQFHSGPGIGSVWAPLQHLCPFCLKCPRKAATDPPFPSSSPRAGPGTSKPHLGLLPGHHTYLWRVGRWGRAPALTGVRWIPALLRQGILNSSSGQQAKKKKPLLGFFLGERTGGGNSQWLEHGLEFPPCAENNYIFVYILLPVWRIISQLPLG